MSMIRIGVVSDTHMNAYDQAFAETMSRVLGGVDMILHAGDITHISVLDCFGQAEVLAVAGNMDQGPSTRDLPTKRIIKAGTKRIGLMHGWGAKQGLMERVAGEFSGDNVDCIVFGHSHQPTNLIKNGILLFNPGTAMGGRPGGTVGLLEVDQGIEGSIIKL